MKRKIINENDNTNINLTNLTDLGSFEITMQVFEVVTPIFEIMPIGFEVPLQPFEMPKLSPLSHDATDLEDCTFGF